MANLDANDLGDRLHRLVKLAMDTGEASTLEEAQIIFSAYRLGVRVGPDVLSSPAHQAALLTIANTGARSFLGGVAIHGIPSDAPLLLPLPGNATLAEALLGLGARIVPAISAGVPVVVLGDVDVDAQDHPLALRATFAGWSGGAAPVATGIRLAERGALPIAGILAGTLAVAEVFQHLRRSNAAAGRREVGLSLWRPEIDWRDEGAFGPAIQRLPSAAWLIGLGNLGQAYLWTLALMPYATPGDVGLVLQDFDFLAPSNESTSVLTAADITGQRKARAMAAWAERRGFKTLIVERPFAADFRVSADDPPVALCGVDNGLARAALEDVGFTRVIEAGLGKGTSDFLALRLHSFPGPKKAREIWNEAASAGADAPKLDLPAYQALATAGVDRCGLTRLAGRTVGAPFVGVTAATLVIAELIRLANGAHAYDFIDGHLRALHHRTVSAAQALPAFNPGTTALRQMT